MDSPDDGLEQLAARLQAALDRKDHAETVRIIGELRAIGATFSIDPAPRSAFDELRELIPELKDPEDIEAAYKLATRLLLGALERVGGGDVGNAQRDANEGSELWQRLERMRTPSGRYSTAIVELEALRPFGLALRLKIAAQVLWWRALRAFWRTLGR